MYYNKRAGSRDTKLSLVDRYIILKICFILCTILFLLSCSNQVKGPSPNLKIPTEQAESLPIEPAVVCRDQHPTLITLSGKGFSPVPVHIPDHPETVLPSITLTQSLGLDGSSISDSLQVMYGGDPDQESNNAFDSDEESPLLVWQSQETMTFTIDQQLSLSDRSTGALTEGIYDVTVTNPTGETIEAPDALAVIGKPILEQLSSGIVCLEESEQSLLLTGQNLLRVGDQKTMLYLSDRETPFSVALSDCTQVAHEGIDTELCTTANLKLPSQSLEAGIFSLSLQNPETAACISEEEISLRVVTKPKIDRVVASLACIDSPLSSFDIEGSGLLRIDSRTPSVTIEEKLIEVTSMQGCEPLETMGHQVESCTSMTVNIGKDALEPGLYSVVVKNPQPADCSGSAQDSLRIVGPPSITDINQMLLCLDEADREFEIKGSDFLRVDSELPEILIDGTAVPTERISLYDCSKLEVPGLTVQRCNSVGIAVEQNSLAAGSHDIRVNNPQPAGCSDTSDKLLEVVEGPEVVETHPVLICTDDGSRQLSVVGNGFLTVEDSLPIVTLNGNNVAVDSVEGCAEIEINGLDVERCTTLNLIVNQGELLEGKPVIAVTNPDPAGCSTSNGSTLTVPTAMTIDSVDPSNICMSNGDTQITIYGNGFLRIDDLDFTFRIDDIAVTPDTITDCNSLEVPGLSVQSCNSFTATLSPELFSPGELVTSINNPAPSDCSSSLSSGLRIVPSPTISNVTPSALCSDVPTTITVTGTNFAEGATVMAGSIAADSVEVDGSTELHAEFENGIPSGLLNVTVQNGVGCSDTVESVINVDPTPIVFFVDPPVIYNGISVEATIFTSGLSSLAQNVQVIDESGNTTDLDFISPTRPNRIQASLPAGEFSVGDYEVRIISQASCAGGLSYALKITDSLTLTGLAIEPAYASPTKTTAVTITNEGGGFQPIPRVYLNPTGGGATAAALRAVVLQDSTTLTAVIPEGLEPGSYDLIVVNPSGEVGVLAGEVTVTVSEPPVITSVLPVSFIHNDPQELVTIRGENFDDIGGVTVQLLCEEAAGPVAALSDPNPVITNDTVKVYFDIANSGLSEGDICLVELINADGSSFAYSAVSIRNNYENLNPWSLSEPLQEPRRALSLVSARPTRTSRFLYAIGGDSGVTDQPSSIGVLYSSIESANVDVYGHMGSWTQQRNMLPEGRTWASAVQIGRFIYLIGGNDGLTAKNTLYRSEILDPLAGPEILDLDARLSEDSGLQAGIWYYRVAATFRNTDPNNPDGESIAGEILNVQLPDGSSGIELKLTWKEVPDANGYRIYRSPMADATPYNLELLYQISCGTDTLCDCSSYPETCQYWDDGATETTAIHPLAPGSLGVWHEVTSSPLGIPREAHATVAVSNPASSDQWFMYAFGGRDDLGNYLDSYEYTTVTINPDLTHSVSEWIVIEGTTGPSVLSSARAEIGAWALTQEEGKIIGETETWIYIGSGRTTDGMSRSIDANLVGVAGDLGTLVELDSNDQPPFHAGYGYGAANNKLFIFGGQDGNASDGGFSAELCDGSGTPDPCVLPDLLSGAWNALGPGNNTQIRIHMGSAQESAFFFLAGGHDGNNTLNTTEQTVQ